MALTWQVLGPPDGDNALLVRVDTGQQVSHLLFDCGEACLYSLSLGEIQSIDHLFFSHLHMDHVCGFDTFFRANFDRNDRVNHLWGPPGTAKTLHHRFQGFTWNLITDHASTWLVHDIDPTRVLVHRFELADTFALDHPGENTPHGGCVWEGPGYSIEVLFLDHGIPSVGYVVREPEKVNVNPEKLSSLGLKPGAWIKQLRGPAAEPGKSILVEGRERDLASLQADLLVRSPGTALAYLTDFHAEAEVLASIAARLHGVHTLICESQYRHTELELARKNHHMTATLVATLARSARVEQLVLFHLSSRYTAGEWPGFLQEARAIFPTTTFPMDWRITE